MHIIAQLPVLQKYSLLWHAYLLILYFKLITERKENCNKSFKQRLNLNVNRVWQEKKIRSPHMVPLSLLILMDRINDSEEF